MGLDQIPTSDDRFARVSDAISKLGKPTRSTKSAAHMVVSSDGKTLAEVKDSPRALTVKMSKADTPEFAQWMRDNAEVELKRLYEAWKSDQQSG